MKFKCLLLVLTWPENISIHCSEFAEAMFVVLSQITHKHNLSRSSNLYPSSDVPSVDLTLTG